MTAEEKIIAVTGGRDFKNADWVIGALNAVKTKSGIKLLVVGDATGADAHARDWAQATGTPLRVFQADWKKHGVAAGPIRNGAMVAFGLDGCVAFPGGRGTADMVRQCEKAGVPVWRVGEWLKP